MLSHEYKFHPADLFRVLMPTLLVCCALLAALKLGARFRLLPPAAAALDPNSTVLAHQARAASSPNPARILLIGDSTCLVGVDAAALSRELGSTWVPSFGQRWRRNPPGASPRTLNRSPRAFGRKSPPG